MVSQMFLSFLFIFPFIFFFGYFLGWSVGGSTDRGQCFRVTPIWVLVTLWVRNIPVVSKECKLKVCSDEWNFFKFLEMYTITVHGCFQKFQYRTFPFHFSCCSPIIKRLFQLSFYFSPKIFRLTGSFLGNSNSFLTIFRTIPPCFGTFCWIESVLGFSTHSP